MGDGTKKSPWRVLLFPAGMETGLEIFRALSPCKEVKLFAAASSDNNHAPFLFEKVHPIPDVRDSSGDWADALNALCKKLQIDWIYPANDIVIDAVNAARDSLAAPVILPPASCVALARSKRRAKAALEGLLPVVETISGAPPSYPAVVKPDGGYGAIGFVLAHNEDEWRAATKAAPDALVERHLPGVEYSVDCFTDWRGALRFCGARMRMRVRMGTSVRGQFAPPQKQKIFEQWAEAISQKFKMRGAWFFQAKEDENENPFFTEVDVRIAGTMALNRVRGVNFPLLSLLDAAGRDVDIAPLPPAVEIDRALLNRYRHPFNFRAVYVDWDDTLLLRGRLNLNVVRFLFQCVNRDARIVLLTKSVNKNLRDELRRWRLLELFDDIIHLREDESKAAHIKEKDAIFIDDSFSQRMEAARLCGVATFDPSMLELLQDDRIGADDGGENE